MKKLFYVILRIIGICLVVVGLFFGTCLILDRATDGFNLDGLLECRSIEDVKNWYSGKGSSYATNYPEAVIVESVSYDRYAYQQIPEEAKQTYDEIYNCIINYDEKVTVVTVDEDILQQAYEAMMADYGNLFWISGYQYNIFPEGDGIGCLEFVPKYTMSEEQKDVYQASVEEISDQWLSGLSSSASDFDKALYVFETLIENVDYNSNSKENQNILSVFLYGETVCQGYADAAWYLLDKLGINSTIITGQANNESHAWNLVYLDGAYYYMDVTWGNSRYLNQNNDTAKRVNYAYMAMTTEEISQNHIITSTFEVPECLSNADNYFVHEGLYYDWFGTDSIGGRIGESYRAGDKEISLKFSSSDLYNRVITYFFDEKHISDYCPDVGKIYYLLDENANVVTIKWE